MERSDRSSERYYLNYRTYFTTIIKLLHQNAFPTSVIRLLVSAISSAILTMDHAFFQL